MTTYQNTTIVINSARESPTVYHDQTVQIESRRDSNRSLADGRREHSFAVRWHGGQTADLAGVSHIRIEAGGAVLVEGALNPAFGPPWSVPNGIQFLID
jgi:hypothetical protein